MVVWLYILLVLCVLFSLVSDFLFLQCKHSDNIFSTNTTEKKIVREILYISYMFYL